MRNYYEEAQAIEVGRAQDIVLDYKFLMWWVDNLGAIFCCDQEFFDDFEE